LKRLTVNNKEAYDILFAGDFGGLGNEFNSEYKDKKIMLIFDSNTEIYKDAVSKELSDVFGEVHTFTFTAGEKNKNLDTVMDIYEAAIKAHFERKDLFAACGGGVCGDMTGFAAATYLRGIKFIQIPTTLLAMCDSSVGGKTGVDFRAYKNMVGSFHQPSLVYMNMKTLLSLPDREYLSGMGEVVKYGYIYDSSMLDIIKDNISAIKHKDERILSELIYRSCDIKRIIVEQDPTEKGVRAILNFGHTIGHAIEKLMNFKLLHGECVSLGMVAAGRISVNRGLISEDDLTDMKKILQALDLPVSLKGADANEILAVTKNDKKMEKGKVKFILLDSVGKAVIDHTVSDEELLSGIREVLND